MAGQLPSARGDGNPPTLFKPADVRVAAGVTFSGAGCFCSAQLVPPNSILQGWLGTPVPGQVGTEVDGVGFDLAVQQGQSITRPVRFIMATARGVRLIDLGQPDIQIGPEGNVLNVRTVYLKDCLSLSGAMLKLALGERLVVSDFVPVPIDGPGWMTAIGATLGVKVQLARFEGLQPGEMLVFESPHYLSTIHADENGDAVVAAVLPLSDTPGPAVIRRLSGQDFTSSVQVQTVEFWRLGSIPDGERVAIKDMDDTVRIARVSRGRLSGFDYALGGQGFVPAPPASLTTLNPQPLPPLPPEVSRLIVAAGLGDNSGEFAIAGFEDARIALAASGDGGGLLVSQLGDGRAKVRGRFLGPAVPMMIDGDFAISRSGGKLHLFSVVRPRPVRLSNDGHS